jgi:uncharacterized protein YndB with AHSA1/START domain
MGVAEAQYVFRSEWHLPAAPHTVYTALADVESYPTWWPQVRRSRRIDDVSGELTCRSLLPYDVVFVMHREVEDPAGLVLRATMAGDLSGTSQWTITAEGDDSLAVFDENVDVGNGMLRTAGRLFRPALRFNHDLMMRAGEKGLRAHLRPGA